MITKKFTIPCTPNITTKTSSDDGDINELIITGVANTGLEDLVGDVVTQEALQSIAEQIPTHNLHLDHDRDLDGVLGPLLEGWVDEQGLLWYKARIVNERSDLIRSYLEQGVNMGSSIAGVCEYEENSNKNIVTWGLTEISLTAVPCDQGTMATVSVAKSFQDVLMLVKELGSTLDGGNDMAEQDEQVTPVTEDKVVELINTAINEMREDITTTIIEEVTKDAEVKLAELQAEIDELRGKIEEGKPEEEDEGEVTPEGEAKPEGEGESKAEDDEEDEEPKPEEAEAEEEEGKPKPEEDDEDEDEDKKAADLQATVQKMVEEETAKAIRDIFGRPHTPSFDYENTSKGAGKEEVESVEKKSYSPEEIAAILTGEQ